MKDANQPERAVRRGDLVRVHMLGGSFAYDGICFSSSKRKGHYILNCRSGILYRPRIGVRIEVQQEAPSGRRISSDDLHRQAKAISWTSSMPA